MSSRVFWMAVLTLWVILLVLEMNRDAESILIEVLPRSLGMLTGSLIPGLMVWGVARTFGAYKEPSQRRAIILVGAGVTLALVFFGMQYN